LSRDHNAAQGTFQDFNALNAALTSSDPATALNPFNSTAPGSPQLLESLNSFDRTAFADQLLGGQGLLRGTLVRLPAGPLQAVFGAEYNNEKQFTATPYGAPLDLQRKYYSFFTEERIPLLAAGAPGRSGDRLALTFAGRYDHSSDFGGKATYQGALEWRPTESLLFRGDYATSYKAPDLLAISGGLFASFLEGGLYDPFRGNSSVPLVPVTLGSNPNLQPETGHSKTLGVVYSSRKWTGLELSLTYFGADITNYITSPDTQTVINNPDIFQGAVVRDPPSPQDVQLGYLGPITKITDTYFNFGFIQIAGVDLDLSYKLTTPIGELVPSLAVTNTFRWDAALTPNTPAVSYVSQANLIGPGFSPRWKGTLALAWKRGPYAANLGARYIGRYKDYQDLMPNSNQLGNFFFYDVNLHYEVGPHPSPRLSWLAGSNVTVGALNLFDRLPEFSYSGNAFDSNESDIVGRFLYASIGVKW